ncbi:MAG: polysaccharide deacetylase family protein [Hyphomicrobiaceae bacterium]
MTRWQSRALYLAVGLVLAPSLAGACPGKLGVSRTVTIDSTGGPLFGGLQYKVESLLHDGEVVLTFDDGPLRKYTRKVLKALSDHCTLATFFMVGRMAVADPSMVREVADKGHTIATHTWSHKLLGRVNPRRAAGEVELGVSAVQHALGKPVAPFFRFPGLSDPKSMIDYSKSRDIAIFSIDIDSYDYRTRNPDRVHRTIMRQLASKKKGILLFHDIQISTARSIKRILNSIQSRGFRIVHFQASEPVKSLEAFDNQAAQLHAKRRYSASIRPVDAVNIPKSTARPSVATRRVRRSATRVRRRRSATTSPQQSDWLKSIFNN